MTKLDDRRLARHATRGERRAFEEIYRRYHRDLYRFCMAIVADRQDAEEALQGTMVKVLRALPGERRAIELRPWLYRIARNEAIETLRRRRDTVELTPERAGCPREIAETAVERERLRTLLADIGDLPGRQRDALLMRELAGLCFAEIAASLDTSPATARQAVYEARLNLHRMEEGRAMRCERAMRVLSEDDGRVTRRRDLRAHLRACASCRAFVEGIEDRRTELAAIAPLPALAAAGILHSLLGSSFSGGLAGGAGGGSLGAGAGSLGAGAVTASGLAKVAAGLAVVAAIGVSTANREGLIDLGPGNTTTNSRSARQAQAAAAASRGEPRRAPRAASRLGDRRHRPGRNAVGVPSAAANGPRSGGAPDLARGESAPSSGATVDSPRASTPTEGAGKHESTPANGRENGPPEAAAHGQATADAHKAPQANPAPGSGRPGPPAPAAPSTPSPVPPAPKAPPNAGPPASPPAGPPADPGPPASPGKSDEHPSSPPPGKP